MAMELTSPATIKELLAKYEARPSKGLGQNFLIDKNILNKIIQAGDIKETDVILEVGPGIGTLTKELAKSAKKVIAVEKDNTMVQILKETLADFKNVQVLEGDILEIELLKLAGNYKIAANIPYYLTSPLIRQFLGAEHKPDFLLLMIQKEVAQRICSKPGQMSLLAVSVQFYAKPEIISYVSKNCFWPAPKIDSAIIKITPENKYDVSPDLFFKIAKAGFAHPRKQLLGNFSSAFKMDKKAVENWLAENKINPKQRAETLSIENWVQLAQTFPKQN